MLHDPNVAFWVEVPAPSMASESWFPSQPTWPPYSGVTMVVEDMSVELSFNN